MHRKNPDNESMDHGNNKEEEKTIRIKDAYNNPTINLALDTIALEKQAIVFANTKASAEKTAEDIAAKIKADEKYSAAHEELSQKALNSLSRPTKQCERLSRCLKKGIAFHHAGLTQKQKDLIEQSFRDKKIKIIAATPTLAVGVDLPAFRAILKDLRRFGHRGLQYIPVLEYLQMAGRAGRPKYDSHGEAIAIASSEAEKDKLYNMYILGEPEDIYSKLAVEPVLRTYLLSLIAGNFVRTRAQILDFFSGTFWAHQYQDMQRLEGIIQKMLDLLIEFEFLVSSEDELEDAFCSADEFQGADILASEGNAGTGRSFGKGANIKYRATKLGKRVAELYLDPLTAHNLISCIRRATQKNLAPFSSIHMVSSTTEMNPLLRVKVKEYEDVQEKLAELEDYLLVEEPSMFDEEYDRFMNSVKTALFFIDWIEENDEEELLDKYSIRPGEIKAKLDIADWLLYSSIELAKLLYFPEIVKELTKARTRLKYGVKEELLPLLKLKSIGRVRARALYRNNIKTIADVKKADASALGEIIKSRKIADDIKEQLGQKVDRISRLKRKGQKGLC